MLVFGKREFMAGSPLKNWDWLLALTTSARPRASSQEFCQGIGGEKTGKNCRKTATARNFYRLFPATGAHFSAMKFHFFNQLSYDSDADGLGPNEC